MSFFPSPFLAKLQDLKLWQGNHEALLQNKSNEVNNPSDFDTIEGLSALDSTRSSVDMSEKHLSSPLNIEWDKKVLTPSKPFEQLLEEKLAEDQPVTVAAKPKKPFLRKGTGLKRYRMSYPQNNKFVRKTSNSNKADCKRMLAFENATKTQSPRHENCFRGKNIENSSSTFKDASLKMPNISMKPKGVWVKVQQSDTNCQTVSKCDLIQDEFKDDQKNFMEQISELALRRLMPSSPSKSVYPNKLSETP